MGTVAERLIAVALRCPCGGRVMVTHGDAGTMALVCAECVGGFDSYRHTNLIDALTAWLVLTGGPISGEVKPPDDERVLCEYATTDEWATKWRVCRITEGTAFSDGRRQDGYVRWFFIGCSPAIIRSWLESEETT